ncbi:30S ribosomal protein S20 [Chloroflexota bacterium]
MPNIESAKKRVGTSAKRRLRNRVVNSQVKTGITKAEKLIFSGELEAAKEAVGAAISSLDRAAEKGIIHSNNATRRKSRLTKKLNQALAASLAEPEAEETKEAE